mgnify:CR=1 FL=1
MYADLVQLLVPGFLSATVRYGGRAFSVRNLSSSDLFLLEKFLKPSDGAWKTWAVALGIWAVDGAVLFENYPNHARALVPELLRAPSELTESLFARIVGFFRRYQRANGYLEAYLYEESSRRLWNSTLKGGRPLSGRMSLPGLERLGTNPIQSSWATFNSLEDDREAQEYAWSLTKVHVSLQSHKGSEKLELRDKHRREDEAARRLEVIERAWNRYRGVEENEGSTERARGRLKSAEELREEMRRWVEGELDEHDREILRYKDRIRERARAREEDRLRALEEIRAARPAEVDRDPLRSMNPAEVAAYFPSNRTRRVFDERAENAKALFEAPVEPGALRVEDGRVYEEPRHVPETPIGRPSLNEALAGRLPRMNRGPE